MMKVLIIQTFLIILVAIILKIIIPLPLRESHRVWLFDRNNSSFQCNVVNNNMTTTSILTQNEINSFQRDGVVILRNVISKEWIKSYRLLLMHTFQNPSRWDIIYSRLLANFYGAQKAIFLHQSSPCGMIIGSDSPVAWIAAELFSSFYNRDQEEDNSDENKHKNIRMRVIEPTEALLNYEDGGGHTAWHRDDTYMNYFQEDEDFENNNKENDKERKKPPVVIRLWIPLMELPSNRMKFLALNNSITSQQERRENNLEIIGTNFSQHDYVLAESSLFSSHIIEPLSSSLSFTNYQMSEDNNNINDGYYPGDAVVFAGDTPHYAKGVNCSIVGCPRLIFSFALDGEALFDSSKKTSLLPLYSGQVEGKPLNGTQFPLIYQGMKKNVNNHSSEDWDSPMTPTYGDIILSIVHAILAGSISFVGYDFFKSLKFVRRVSWAFVDNIWVKPQLDLETGVVVDYL